ncbi:3-hydroxy-3-methylglutaryl-coenzyme A reductase [Giardia lamblia P15]|uniref:3-hydroxy-3-methylglutaryl-coenzyme A reductase n=1 Tax=Giardia intestinalis (strain P15) TaxID=658858 RepID=E1EVW0_GIAIA|nr:3-hydroxy-3-methylglutaryl-coenzyme A reductase [Giardia lamblia P15]
MRTLQYPEERINWLEEHKAINNELGDELRAFAAVIGLDGPAQMYGFTNDARVRSASITSPIRSAYAEMRENSGKIKEIVCENDGKRPSSPSLVVTDPLTNALQIALAQAKVRSDHEVSKYSRRIQALDTMSENVIGATMLPLSVVPDVLIDGIMYTVPISTEEPSVVAALAHAAKIFRVGKGVRTLGPTNPFILGQLIFMLIDGQWKHPMNLSELENLLSRSLATHLPNSRNYGKGIVSCYLRKLNDYILLEIGLDPGEAMGANMINGFMEAIAPDVERYLTKFGRVERLTSILSNSGAGREYEAIAKITVEDYAMMKNITVKKAEDILRRIEALSQLAEIDTNRRITHNKGVLNGIVGVALACGQDTRAIDVANCQLGHIKPLVTHKFNSKELFLRSTARISAPVGVIGGSSKLFWGLSILGQAQENRISSSSLGRILAAVGLLQNFAALQALVTNGIQHGHMKLHNRKLVTRESPIATASSVSASLQASNIESKTTPAKIATPFMDNQDKDKNKLNTALNESLKRIEDIISHINYTPEEPNYEAKMMLTNGESDLYRYFSPAKLSPVRNLQQPSLRMQSPKRQTYAIEKLASQTLLDRVRTRSPILSQSTNSSSPFSTVNTHQPTVLSTLAKGLVQSASTYNSDQSTDLFGSGYGKPTSSSTLTRQMSYSPNRLNSFSVSNTRTASPVKSLEMEHWEGTSGARNELSTGKRPYNIVSPSNSKYTSRRNP